MTQSMIPALAAALMHIGLQPTAEEVADALWLAIHMGSVRSSQDERPAQDAKALQQIEPERFTKKSGTELATPTTPSEPASNIYTPSSQESGIARPGSGIMFRTPAAFALPGALELTRALRPLMRRIPSNNTSIFDEEATVRRIADEHIWVPALRPAPARWFEITLVVDEGASMDIWHQTVAELQNLFECHGAFRNVRRWGIVTDIKSSPAEVRLHSGRGQTTYTGRARNPRELIDPSRQRLILVVTDCVSPAWYNGAMARLLSIWGRDNTVAIIQLLPQTLWDQSALRFAKAIRIFSSSAGVPNTQLRFEMLNRWTNKKSSSGVQVPIMTLERVPIVAWANMVVGSGGAWTPGFIFSAEKKESKRTSLSDISASPAQRVERFRAIASPSAFKLAGLLAAAPLRLPVMRLVQQTILPHSRQVHLAEVFLSGLLKRVNTDKTTRDPDAIQYDFVDGVRDILLDEADVPDTVQVFKAVSKAIAGRIGQAFDFQAILNDPTIQGDFQIDEQDQPFADVAAKILYRLGGAYAEVAKRLEMQANISVTGDAQPVSSSVIAQSPAVSTTQSPDSMVHTDELTGKMQADNDDADTVNSLYENGIQSLLVQMNQENPNYSEVLTLRARLQKNIRNTSLYGSAATTLSERSAILASLNQLTGQVLDTSFTDLCVTETILTYIRKIQQSIQYAFDLFDNKKRIWEADIEQIMQSLQKVKPVTNILPPDISYAAFITKLDYVQDQINQLLQLLASFRLARTEKRHSRTQQQIRDKLIELIQDLEQIPPLVQENIYKRSLDREAETQLIQALLQIPGIDNFSLRSALLSGIASSLTLSLQRSSTSTHEDISLLVSQLIELYSPTGERALQFLIDTAISYVEGTTLGEQLKQLRRILIPSTADPSAEDHIFRFTNGYALIIGIANYPHIHRLPAIVLKDAQDIRNTLSSPDYCGYLPSNTVLLLDNQATADNIRRALLKLADMAEAETTLFIFFSGYCQGIAIDSHTKHYLFPYDYDPANLDGTAIAGEEFTTLLQNINCRNLLICFDNSYAVLPPIQEENQAPLKFARGFEESYYTYLSQITRGVVMASSRAEEVSLVIPDMSYTLFTHYLLEALKGKADTQGDGFIRIADVVNYISKEVKAHKPQHMVFMTKNAEKNFPIALSQETKQEEGNLSRELPQNVELEKYKRVVADIEQTLVVTDPRFFTSELIMACVDQLSQVIKAIHSMQEEGLWKSNKSRNAILSNISDARVELIVALDELEKRGMTRKVYQHLESSRSRIRRALNVW